MSRDQDSSFNAENEGTQPRRRQRYRGTHPRQYQERYKELHPDAFPEMQEHILAQGRTPAGTHVPILVAEVMATLSPGPRAVVVDCTVGYGGHAVEFAKRIGAGGVLIGLDIDGLQLERTAGRLRSIGLSIVDCRLSIGESTIPALIHAPAPEVEDTAREQWHTRVILRRSHFAGVGKVLAREGFAGADIIFADLGVSSMQVDDPSRGFSYKFDGPLDMRMDDRLKKTAADLLAGMSEGELSEALRKFADEPDHERIARLIVQRRTAEPITRTKQLVRLIFEAKGISQRAWREAARRGSSRGLKPDEDQSSKSEDQNPVSREEELSQRRGERGEKNEVAATSDPLRPLRLRKSSDGQVQSTIDQDSIHPAARTFQALRMLVNDEAAGLDQFLRVAPHCLKSGGRIGVISFHSGEDRRVKHAFRDGLRSGFFEAISDEVIRPTSQEIAVNPRARSAKLRWARRAAT